MIEKLPTQTVDDELTDFDMEQYERNWTEAKRNIGIHQARVTLLGRWKAGPFQPIFNHDGTRTGIELCWDITEDRSHLW